MTDLDLGPRSCAGKIGAGLGCTRPLDRGRTTGCPPRPTSASPASRLSPKVYIAVGISGQMQHMVGVQPLRRCLRHQQGQERPRLQAVRLRSGGRPQDDSPGACRGTVGTFDSGTAEGISSPLSRKARRDVRCRFRRNSGGRPGLRGPVAAL